MTDQRACMRIRKMELVPILKTSQYTTIEHDTRKFSDDPNPYSVWFPS